MANAVRIRNIRYQFLDKIKVFEKMDRYKKLKLLDGLEVQFFATGHVICKEDEIGEYFYIIEEGAVECSKKDGEGNDQFVRKLEQGEYFGEIALTNDESKRTLTVKASEETKVLAMKKETFFQCLPDFSNYLSKEYIKD